MTAPDDCTESRVTEIVSGRFRIRRLVARGGMADVYEAEDLQSGRTGALKLLKARFLHVPDAVERLSREAAAARRIADPHIVQTLDAGRFASGEPYVFMELLTGEPLDRVIARRGRLPIREAVDLVRQAARALCAAHAAGVLHRDIKPANLFLVEGPRSLVKLLDFGVSKFVGTGLMSLTREGLALGTFAYMPPEQMVGAKRVDERADLFSLGVVLYQCVVGTPPFVAKSIPALSNVMAKNEYVRVSCIRPDTPPEFDAVLDRSLRADPRERYANAREFHDALDRLSRCSMPHRTLSVGGAGLSPPQLEQRPRPVVRAGTSASATGSPGPAAPRARGSATSEVLPAASAPSRRRRPSPSLVETIVPQTRRRD